VSAPLESSPLGQTGGASVGHSWVGGRPLQGAEHGTPSPIAWSFPRSLSHRSTSGSVGAREHRCPRLEPKHWYLRDLQGISPASRLCFGARAYSSARRNAMLNFPTRSTRSSKRLPVTSRRVTEAGSLDPRTVCRFAVYRAGRIRRSSRFGILLVRATVQKTSISTPLCRTAATSRVSTRFRVPQVARATSDRKARDVDFSVLCTAPAAGGRSAPHEPDSASRCCCADGAMRWFRTNMGDTLSSDRRTQGGSRCKRGFAAVPCAGRSHRPVGDLSQSSAAGPAAIPDPRRIRVDRGCCRRSCWAGSF